MRVLIVNKFYYRRGGDCVVAMQLEQMLRDNGHTTAVYAMDYSENIPTPWSPMYASEVTYSGSLPSKLRATWRALGHGDIRRSFAKMLREFRPDIVHLHNIHSYLSPVIAEMSRDFGARVVWTLHDYKLLCPTYSCLTPQGAVCEDCFTGHPGALLSRRCHKGSLAASLIARLEALTWTRSRLERATDAFICPSHFMAAKMAQGGYNPRHLNVITNCHDAQGRRIHTEREPYYLYAGRLSREKGIETLLRAASTLGYNLIVAGDGPLAPQLRKQYANSDCIRLIGRIDGTQVQDYMARARFTVIPSEWYENNPLSVIESLCAGTPVLGAEIGGIPELIDPTCGITFPSGDAEALTSAIDRMWHSNWSYNAIADSARTRFSPDTHYDRLIELYNRITAQ